MGCQGFSLILCRGESLEAELSHWFWRQRGSILNFRSGFLSSIEGRLPYPCPNLLFLAFSKKIKKARKPLKKQGSFLPDEPLNPCKRRENTQKDKEFLAKEKSKEFQKKTRERRSGECLPTPFPILSWVSRVGPFLCRLEARIKLY